METALAAGAYVGDEQAASQADDGDEPRPIRSIEPRETDEDRRHWAFQPPSETTGYQSIDEFTTARLDDVGLKLAESADLFALSQDSRQSTSR